MIKTNLLFFFLNILLISGQSFKHFDIEKGLPSNRIYKVIQDKQDFIWVATDKGLSKFDGDRFVTYTTSQGLPSNDIWEIYNDSQNRLWYFTRANSMGYIKNGKVYNFHGENPGIFYPSYINRTPDSISFYSFGNFYRLSEGKWKKIKNTLKGSVRVHHPEIAALQFHNKDSLLVFDHHNKLIKKWAYNKNPVKKNAQINDSLYVILTGKDLYFLNLNRLELHKVPKIPFVDYEKFIRFYAGPSSVQISGYNFWSELSKDYTLSRIKKFDTSYNLSNIFKDNKNNFWLNSYNKGLFFSSENSLNAQYHFLNKKIKFLKTSKGNKLIAGILDEGIYEYHPEKQKFEMVFPVRDFFYNVYYIDKNNFVLFGKDFALIKKEGKLTEYLPSGRKGILFNNHYYTTSLEGLKKFTTGLEYITTIPLKDPLNFAVFNKHLIIGGLDGLYRLADNEKDFEKVVFERNSLDLPVTSLALYKNKLLIGTDGKGLYLWDGKKQLLPVKKTGNLIVKDILVQDAKIWIATQKGVMGFKENGHELEFFQTLRKYDGLVSDQVDEIEFINGKLAAASLNGISVIDTHHHPNLPLQSIYFKNISYGKEKTDKKQLKVKYHDKNNLIVKFGAIDFSGQEHNHFYYRIFPNQKNWMETKSKIIEFNNLQPAKYQLQIKGINPYGQNLKKSFFLEIEPLWWQTNWAKTAMAAGLLLVFGLTSFYMRKKELAKQRKKLLEQKEKVEFELYALRSQMNPHFVFNSLNAIQYYINDENYDKSEEYLVKFSRLIRMIFDFSRQKSVALRDEIKLLKSYLEIEKMRFGEDFNFCINIDPVLNIDQTEIPTMLLQPIVENAVNHGIFHKQGKGTICLDFKKEDANSFLVSISDDGIGVAKAQEINKKSLKRHRSRSTEILKKRIQLLNMSGKWKISYEMKDLTEDKTEYSTRVSLKITKL